MLGSSFDARRSNVIVGVALAIGILALCRFVAALMGANTEGEIAGALGSFVGGVIGAGGAVLAVYVALSSQRNEETAKVSAAVRTEVASLTTYVIGAIEICQGIANGTQRVPSVDASYIMQKLWAEPVIYPAVADRVGLLPHPNATVQFYMRLSEAKAMTQSLEIKTDRSMAALAQSQITPLFVKPEFAQTIADSLITALQLARAILADELEYNSRAQLSEWVGRVMVGQIDECLRSAKASFPNATSFQAPSE